MSKIGLISDTHANVSALQLVYNGLRRRYRLKRFWFLGDAVGYGPDPVQTFKLLAEKIRPEIWLAGNHDHYATPSDPNDPGSPPLLRGAIYNGSGEHVKGPRESAWDVAKRHRAILDDAFLARLRELPERDTLSGLENVFLAHAVYTSDAHGSKEQWLETKLLEPDELAPFFTLPDAPWHACSRERPILHIAGHSHIQGLWEHNGSVWVKHGANGEPDEDVVYPLRPGHFYYINPGGVGFPRGNRPCPAAAVLDTEAWTVTFHTFCGPEYDTEQVRERMRSLDYPSDLYSERQFKPCRPNYKSSGGRP